MTSADDHHYLHFENVWGIDVPPNQELIMELWKRNGGPVGEEAQKRLRQLVIVARNQRDEVIGVSTAFKAYVKHLRTHFFIVRLMLGAAHHMPGLSARLLVSTRDVLESLYDPEGATDPIGILMLGQRDLSATTTSEAIWPASKMVYIGNTAEGHRIRVYYFKGARIVP